MLLVSDWCYYGNMLMSGVAMETYLDLEEWGCYICEWGCYEKLC